MLSIINNLKKNGFVNAGCIGLSNSEIDELSELANKNFEKFRFNNANQKYIKDYFPPKEGSEIIVRFPQQDKKAFLLVEKVLKNKKINSILTEVLGKNYKLKQIALRRSLPNDKGLYLHQDGLGETNLGIMLSDNLDGNGITNFLKASHFISKRMKEWDIETPPFIMKFFLFIMDKIKGKKGNCYFFFNRVWHGRSPNKTNLNHDVILMSFYPNEVLVENDTWDNAFLKSIEGTKFIKLLNLNNTTFRSIVSLKPFAISIEEDTFKMHFYDILKMYTLIFFLITIFRTYRLLKNIFKL